MNADKSEPLNEQQLVQQLATGEPAAVQTLVTLYSDDVYRFVYNQVGGSVQDAEDIVQETFVAALKAIPHFRGQSKVRTWLYSIAAHKVADHHRRRARQPRLDFQEITENVLADTPLPEQRLEYAEIRQAVRQALAQLPPHYRTALVLKYIELAPVQEIAKIMARSEKSIESILVRARRLLEKLFEANHGG
jgi:RNA polymerase sigma-70 factor (ECF subfamily)